MLHCNRVVAAEDETILCPHILGNAELGVYIVLHLIVIAIQMVWRNVHKNGNICTEIVHSIQLKTAQFQHIVIVLLCCHKIGVALSNVASQPHIHSCSLHHIVDEGGSGGLAVAAGNTDLLGGVISSCKLYLGDDMDAPLPEGHNQRSALRNSRALYNLVCIENLGLGMAALFVLNVVSLKSLFKGCANLAAVAQEDIKSLYFGQYSGTYAALSTSKYNNPLHQLSNF